MSNIFIMICCGILGVLLFLHISQIDLTITITQQPSTTVETFAPDDATESQSQSLPIDKIITQTNKIVPLTYLIDYHKDDIKHSIINKQITQLHTDISDLISDVRRTITTNNSMQSAQPTQPTQPTIMTVKQIRNRETGLILSVYKVPDVDVPLYIIGINNKCLSVATDYDTRDCMLSDEEQQFIIQKINNADELASIVVNSKIIKFPVFVVMHNDLYLHSDSLSSSVSLLRKDVCTEYCLWDIGA